MILVETAYLQLLSIESDGTDSEIQEAMHGKVLTACKCSKTVVVDEPRLVRAKNWIDIAVSNGHLLGYEIKSVRDALIQLLGKLGQHRTAF